MPRRAEITPIHAPGQRDGLPWKVDIAASVSASGKREKTFYRTKDAAEQFCRDERARAAEFSESARNLTGEQKLEAYKCLKIAQENGFTITGAVNAMAQQVQLARQSITVPKLVDELIARKTKEGRRPHYLRDLKNRLRRFSEAFPETLACELTPAAIETWLATLTEHTAVSRNNYRRILGVACSFAVDRGWMASNPVEKVAELPQLKDEVAIFHPDQIEALLTACDGSIRPAVAIGAFAGIRPEEILTLQWSEVRLDHGDILVLGRHAKTGSRRLVTIMPNLAAWLEKADRPDAEAVAPVVPINFRKRLVAARKAAKIAVWPRDVLRHSFASHHLALGEDAAATALQLGHTTTKMLFANYRGLVRKPDAVRYFDIRP